MDRKWILSSFLILVREKWDRFPAQTKKIENFGLWFQFKGIFQRGQTLPIRKQTNQKKLAPRFFLFCIILFLVGIGKSYWYFDCHKLHFFSSSIDWRNCLYCRQCCGDIFFKEKQTNKTFGWETKEFNCAYFFNERKVSCRRRGELFSNNIVERT